MFDICDDYGVWIVVPNETGRWDGQEDAQEECNRRNFAAGLSDVDGELKNVISSEDEKLFDKFHYSHPECTCVKK